MQVWRAWYFSHISSIKGREGGKIASDGKLGMGSGNKATCGNVNVKMDRFTLGTIKCSHNALLLCVYYGAGVFTLKLYTC